MTLEKMPASATVGSITSLLAVTQRCFHMLRVKLEVQARELL